MNPFGGVPSRVPLGVRSPNTRLNFPPGLKPKSPVPRTNLFGVQAPPKLLFTLKDAGYMETNDMVGEGGMGQVWIVKKNGKKLIAKTSSGLNDAHIRKEWTMMSKLKGIRGIPEVHDLVALANGSYHLIMDFIDGRDIPSFFRTCHMTWAQKAHFAMRLYEILEQAWSRGVVHRDLKGDNVMVVEEKDGFFEPVVIDWGLACSIGKDTTSCGTKFAMAPEMFIDRMSDKANRSQPSVDIWGLGVVLYELLFDQDPFHKFQDCEELEEGILDLDWATDFDGETFDDDTIIFFNSFFKNTEDRIKRENLKFWMEGYFCADDEVDPLDMV